jgi:hypothetical protein
MRSPRELHTDHANDPPIRSEVEVGTAESLPEASVVLITIPTAFP